eukprot:3235613-Amphidinium_carterae.1
MSSRSTLDGRLPASVAHRFCHVLHTPMGPTMVCCPWHSGTAPCSCALLLAQASRSRRALVAPLIAGVALL